LCRARLIQHMLRGAVQGWHAEWLKAVLDTQKQLRRGVVLRRQDFQRACLADMSATLQARRSALWQLQLLRRQWRHSAAEQRSALTQLRCNHALAQSTLKIQETTALVEARLCSAMKRAAVELLFQILQRCAAIRLAVSIANAVHSWFLHSKASKAKAHSNAQRDRDGLNLLLLYQLIHSRKRTEQRLAVRSLHVRALEARCELLQEGQVVIGSNLDAVILSESSARHAEQKSRLEALQLRRHLRRDAALLLQMKALRQWNEHVLGSQCAGAIQHVVSLSHELSRTATGKAVIMSKMCVEAMCQIANLVQHTALLRAILAWNHHTVVDYVLSWRLPQTGQLSPKRSG